MSMLYDDEHFCIHCNKKVPHVHFCTPAEESKKYTCEYCGTENINHRHMCSEKLKHIKFYCKNCGAVAVDETHVCNPVPIESALKEHWDKIEAKSKSKSETETETESKVLLSCGVCGQPVEPPGHYCDQKFPYTCEYCGEEITSGYHHCKEKSGKYKYICKTCGRLGVKPTDICAPAPFD